MGVRFPRCTANNVLRDLAAQVCAVFPPRAVLSVLGGPGSGKGALCKHLAFAHGWDVFSTGALLRAQAERDPALCASLRRGELVPPAVSARAVLERLLQSSGAPVVVVDGFPRDENAAALWAAINAPESPALFLECNPDTLRARLNARGRVDDDADVVEHRVRFHLRETPRLWRFYADRGLAFHVDAEGSIDDVSARVDKTLTIPPLSSYLETLLT